MDNPYLRDAFEELIGEKVILQLFKKEDITLEYVSWLNDPEVVKYSNQRFFVHSLETVRVYFAGFNGTQNLFLKIIQKTDGLFVGTMTAYVSLSHQTVDIGIMVGYRAAWGNGIGQDAWNTLIQWLLKQRSVRKVTAGAMCCNSAMVKLIERSGMIFEALRPGQELLDGVPQDLIYFGKFREI